MLYSDLLGIGPRRPSNSRSRKRQSGSVLVTFTLTLPFLLVPLVGLAIDGTMLFSVKAKLQTAVDGGAIAAAQSLNSGMTFAVQQVAAETTAKQFVAANMNITAAQPKGYWGSTNLNDTTCDNKGTPSAAGTNKCVIAAQDDTNMRRTVQISASVDVPLLFMRVLGFSNAKIAASGQAARRDVVLVLVIDRSSSMSDKIQAVKDGATYFTKQFQAGRDRLGLVVFGGSALVAYPPGDWNKATANFTGPNTDFMKTPDSSAVPNMLTSISNIADSSNTGTAEGMMLAYKELVAAAQPGALNVIVLFTDGMPNGITAYFNPVTGSVIKNTNPKSPCVNKTDGGVSTKSMIGWMGQGGGYSVGANGSNFGIRTLAQTDSSTNSSVTGWVSETGSEPAIPGGAGKPGEGCAFETNQSNIQTDLTIPLSDFYGNSTTGLTVGKYKTTDYQQSTMYNGGSMCNKTAQDLTKSGNACQVGLASWNATDMAAKQIKEDGNNLKPVIYSMGYTGADGADEVLMKRMSNVNDSVKNTVYDSTKPQGMYLPISSVNDISPAFQRVLSEILRLAF